jgi:hypothetical protein
MKTDMTIEMTTDVMIAMMTIVMTTTIVVGEIRSSTDLS